MDYWQIFSSFLIFCCCFTRLKAREISCKIWKTRKIFPILHSAPYDNNYLFSELTIKDDMICIMPDIDLWNVFFFGFHFEGRVFYYHHDIISTIYSASFIYLFYDHHKFIIIVVFVNFYLLKNIIFDISYYIFYNSSFWLTHSVICYNVKRFSFNTKLLNLKDCL